MKCATMRLEIKRTGLVLPKPAPAEGAPGTGGAFFERWEHLHAVTQQA